MTAPAGRDEARPPGTRRDASVLIAALTCLAVFLVLGVPLIASRLAGSGSPGTVTTTSVAGRPGSGTSPAAPPTATPETQPPGDDDRVEPGLEPPEPRPWPTWPHFDSADSTRLMRNLPGVEFRMPATWSCRVTERDGGAGYVRHSCGDEHGVHHGVVAAPEVKLIVGDCRAPCDADTHEQLRRDVPGWGRRWLAPDDNTTYIETSGVIDGEEAYGLVISRVYASDGTGVPDRHLILRSVSARDDVPTIQKLANEIRETTS